MSTMGFIANNNKSRTKTPAPTGHSLTIGETGSGKTTSVIRPLIRQAVEAGSSILLVDEKNLLHLDLKLIESDAINKVFQLGGIGQGSNDLSINLLEIIKTKKQFRKFADSLVGVERSGESHNFWAKSASNMLVDVYCVLDSLKKVIQYAQRHIVTKKITLTEQIEIKDKKKSLTELLDNDSKSPIYHDFRINGKTLTLTELFHYFNSRIDFKILTENINTIYDLLKDKIVDDMKEHIDEREIEELDDLMSKLEEQSKSIQKWKIPYESGDNSGNNGVYFSVTACLGELAEVACINAAKGDNLIDLLESGKHLVINSENLSSQVVSTLLSCTLDILSSRAKRENVQPVAVIIDEASRVINSDTELHTDFLRQAKVCVHLATQHESQMIEMFGLNRWKTYQTNFPDIFSLSTHTLTLKPFSFHDKKTDMFYESTPLFFNRKDLLKAERKFQTMTDQFKSIHRSRNEVLVYDTRLHELKESLICINITTLEESEIIYKLPAKNNRKFFQEFVKTKKKHVEMCEVIR